MSKQIRKRVRKKRSTIGLERQRGDQRCRFRGMDGSGIYKGIEDLFTTNPKKNIGPKHYILLNPTFPSPN
jgi:hypothetical protein